MKLYEMAPGQRFVIDLEAGKKEMEFHKVDGMYAIVSCEGQTGFIKAWTDVEAINESGE